jgi:hypothetical protein
MVFFTKIGEQEGRTGPFLGVGTNGRESIWGKSEYGRNIMYSYMKMEK